uniref:Uncharacterized protein n=1 Tax=Aegilops tauschii subsp. strangulata TaxID=200361 RepID=A0A453EQ14_AEGTS
AILISPTFWYFDYEMLCCGIQLVVILCRSGGNWSTTYAPSPFYLTSKMRSLYLEGYDYSIFDLTKPDRVQIQVYGNSVQGRILQGESPTELITSYTGSTGRPPVLPRWITSGAVVGMQGGTEAVRRVWRQLQDHDVPVSAFWLQVRSEEINKRLRNTQLFFLFFLKQRQKTCLIH